MKKLATLLCLISLSSFACEMDFPKQLECLNSQAIDEDLFFEFTKINEDEVKMNMYERNVGGMKLLNSSLMKIRKNKLKSEQFKAKFSKDFKTLIVFKEKKSLVRKKFSCQ